MARGIRFYRTFLHFARVKKYPAMRESHAFRVRFSPCRVFSEILALPCVFGLTQRAKTCDTNYLPRATA